MAFKDYSVSGWSLRILTESEVPEVSQRLLKLISIEHREIDETAFSWSLPTQGKGPEKDELTRRALSMETKYF